MTAIALRGGNDYCTIRRAIIDAHGEVGNKPHPIWTFKFRCQAASSWAVAVAAISMEGFQSMSHRISRLDYFNRRKVPCTLKNDSIVRLCRYMVLHEQVPK